MRVTTNLLTEQQMAHYECDGYCAMPHFFDGREVRAMVVELEQFKREGLGRNVVTEGALLGSTTTLMPAVSTRMSRLAGASCKSILYCSPEQPPPTTATRSTPWARPCLVSSELTLCAALGVTLIM